MLSFKMVCLQIFFPEDTGGHPWRSRVTFIAVRVVHSLTCMPLLWFTATLVMTTDPIKNATLLGLRLFIIFCTGFLFPDQIKLEMWILWKDVTEPTNKAY